MICRTLWASPSGVPDVEHDPGHIRRDLLGRRGRRAQHGNAAQHRFDDHEPEALDLAGEHQCVRRPQHAARVLVAEELDPGGDPQAAGSSAQGFLIRALTCDQRDDVVLGCTQGGDGVDQRVRTLVRVERAHEGEDELTGLDAPAPARHIAFVAGRRSEVLRVRPGATTRTRSGSTP